jgi:transcriptional regulator with XRE-family HTH domain
MTIAAHFEEPAQAAGMPRGARRTLRFETTGEFPAGSAAGVRVHNISATGLLLETAAVLAEGEDIAIDLPLAGLCQARVVWSSDCYYGCRFAEPLAQATLSAVELRSEAAPGGRDPSFGKRLQRLRTERGLTQTQIANALGVSKPTVWAWEHGKARPVAGRMAALAGLLGVTLGDVVQGAPVADHGGLIAQCREQIATAYGIDRGMVKISIDL